MKKLICALCVLFSLSLQAQDFNNYIPVMSSGSLPDAVIMKARDKYLKDIESAEGDKKDKKLRKEFILINSYETEKLRRDAIRPSSPSST